MIVENNFDNNKKIIFSNYSHENNEQQTFKYTVLETKS